MILWQLGAAALITVVCKIHADLFDRQKPIGPMFHVVWAAVYLVPCGIIAWLEHSWVLAAAFAVERFVGYNLILNALRKRSPFYIQAGKNGSRWDELELWWAKSYIYFWAPEVGIYLTLQYLLWRTS